MSTLLKRIYLGKIAHDVVSLNDSIMQEAATRPPFLLTLIQVVTRPVTVVGTLAGPDIRTVFAASLA